jgi:3-oxoadipate enol-lactonase
MKYVIVNDDVRLAYRVDGAHDAPTLVFINSLGTELRMWDRQVAALTARFRIVRYDTRGHGRSGVPGAPATIERLGHDLLALLDHLHIERTHICGVSLGGLTALWFAAHHPERVERAVFANTAARIGSAESWSARIATVQAHGMHAVRDTVIARFLSAPFRARHPDVAHTMGDMLEATDPAGYVAACAALRDADLRARVPTIGVPSLIVAGALDEATPPSQSEELHIAVKESELAMLSAGHLSNIEQPTAFNAHLLRFLISGIKRIQETDDYGNGNRSVDR